MYCKTSFKIGDKYKNHSIDYLFSLIEKESYDMLFQLDTPGFVAYGTENNEKLALAAAGSKKSLKRFFDFLADEFDLRVDDGGTVEISPSKFYSLVNKAREDEHMLLCQSNEFQNEVILDGLSIEMIPVTNTYMNSCRFRSTSSVSYPSTLEKELKRIENDTKACMQYRNQSSYYLISSNRERREIMRKTLLKALRENNLLDTKYYAYVEITNHNDEDYSISLDILNRTLNVIWGGVIVLVLEDENIFASKEAFYDFIDIMRGNYCNTLIMESSYYDDNLLEKLTTECSDLNLRLIQDPGLTKKEAKEILENTGINSAHKKKCMDILFKETRKNYYSYSEIIQIIDTENSKETITNDSLDAFSTLPHLENAKDLIASILLYSSMLEERKNRGMKSNHSPALNMFKRDENRLKTDIPSLNILFHGERGTGKETVAKLYSDILRKEGIINNNIQFVQKADLMANTPHASIDAISKVFNNSRGGLLFIDWQEQSLEEKNKDRECIILDNIIHMAEKHSGELVVILSLSEEGFADISKRSPGLLSLFPYSLQFPSYTNKELWDIFSFHLQKKGLKVEEGVKECVFDLLERMRNDENFSFGDTINNIVTKGEEELSRRVDTETKDDDLITLRVSDFL